MLKWLLDQGMHIITSLKFKVKGNAKEGRTSLSMFQLFSRLAVHQFMKTSCQDIGYFSWLIVTAFMWLLFIEWTDISFVICGREGNHRYAGYEAKHHWRLGFLRISSGRDNACKQRACRIPPRIELEYLQHCTCHRTYSLPFGPSHDTRTPS